MIRVAIVEDEAEIREQLMGYVQRYTRQYGTAFEVKTFADGLEILEDYRPAYDLILLDIEMKHLDGMETARRIRELDPDVMLVFITNMAQYAIKGYAVGALDYAPPRFWFPGRASSSGPASHFIIQKRNRFCNVFCFSGADAHRF